jgi:O-antigen ligase
MRGDSVRAMASSGHPLELGYLLAIAFGFWLFLQNDVGSRRRRVYVSILFWLGLIAAYSRGPWFGAVAIYFIFALLNPKGIRKLVQATALSAGILGVISMTPLANRIIRVIPFLGGTVDSGNIDYRQRLLERSWGIIEQSPIFGDQDARLKMQDMRQGEGIIDMINTYMQILLDNGFVGLFLFLTFILVAAYRAFMLSRRLARIDHGTSQLGASLVACMVGTLIMIESGGSDRVMISVLVGIMAAYACMSGLPIEFSPKAHRPTSQPGLKATSDPRSTSAS